MAAPLTIGRERKIATTTSSLDKFRDGDPSAPPSICSVKDVGYAENKNHRWRATMEDDHVVVDKYGGDSTQGLFALYDGHGGRQAVDYVVQKLHEVLLDELESSSYEDISKTLEKSFLKVDDQLRVTGAFQAGTTAVVCLVRQEGATRVVYVANVGDSRAVLGSGGRAYRLSYDDKGTDESEIDRVRHAGGILIRFRVGGQLAVTRALGDHALKCNGLIANPHVVRHPVESSDTVLILASDGLWDVVDDQEAVNEVAQETTANAMSERLCNLAMSKGSRDNVSVIVIIL